MKTRSGIRPTVARAQGFSLVELLVVVGLVAVLISLLLPALSRAREQANRTKCASNLKQWGAAVTAFAGDHEGYLPRAFRNHFDVTHTAYPTIINNNDSDETTLDATGRPKWMTVGTPWKTFQKYGVSEQVALCPSSGTLSVAYAKVGDPNDDGNWDPFVQMDYMFFAQINTDSGFEQSYHNHVRTPVRASDPSGPIAADKIYRGGGSENGYGSGGHAAADDIEINHVWANPYMPDAQNVLYSDGSVQMLRGNDYVADANGKIPLPDSSTGGASAGHSEWSLIHYFDGAIFYWEGNKPAH